MKNENQNKKACQSGQDAAGSAAEVNSRLPDNWENLVKNSLHQRVLVITTADDKPVVLDVDAFDVEDKLLSSQGPILLVHWYEEEQLDQMMLPMRFENFTAFRAYCHTLDVDEDWADNSSHEDIVINRPVAERELLGG